MWLTPPPVDDWFTYDADNRVVINNGSLVNGAIRITAATGSAENGYDAAGNVTTYTTIDSALRPQHSVERGTRA